MDIQALRAFEDNYIWLLRDGHRAVVVDPGDEAPVLQSLAGQDASLAAILLTHHHGDHTGGVAGLLALQAGTGFGPAGESIAGITHPLREGDTVVLPGSQDRLQVMEVPGHTRGHIAYYGIFKGQGALFCGDTLFGCGCGRLFEGTADQMWTSLCQTRRPSGRHPCILRSRIHPVECSFCPWPWSSGNAALLARAAQVAELRAANLPTVPFYAWGRTGRPIPFLRSGQPDVAAAAERHCGTRLLGANAVFAVLREWKNTFRQCPSLVTRMREVGRRARDAEL
ncbi:MAG: hydroxyacylglutathione hydrolase [Rhodocyclaceae bacterium]|nr:hydroxyacylglutathione hydrolase [Rhodocyclaceae bacterium]